jgi:hypothetical protein
MPRNSVTPTPEMSGRSERPAKTEGWIYVLDPRMTVNGKAVVKVGYTTRTVEERSKELGTGIPGGLSVAYKLRVDNARLVEGHIHRILRPTRVSRGPGREFFAITVGDAIATIEKIALQISSERVQQARYKEIEAFRKNLGLPCREFFVFSVPAVFVIASLFILVNMSGWQLNVGSAIFFFIALYLIIRGAKAIHTFLYEHLVERPFGEKVRAKIKEAEKKYPFPTPPTTRYRNSALSFED